MHSFYFRKISVLCIFLLLPAGVAVSQTQRPAYERSQNYDVQHYTLRVKPDHAKRSIEGDTTVILRPTEKGVKVVELDAVGLKFTSVKLESDDKDLTYRVLKDKVAVTLDREYGTDEDIAIRFAYTAAPKKGIYFVDEGFEEKRRVHSKQIWTQGEPDEARHWFPSFDFPGDKATTEQFITAEKGMTVIGNGEELGKKDNGDGTETHHFRLNIPHSTYLVSFIIGEYVKIEDKYRDIPLGYYTYPEARTIVPLAYGKTKDFFGIMEELTATPYPFNKYDQTVVAKFEFGGMENITATTMADTEIAYARLDFLRGNVEDLVTHEIAHSWFGNNVTCKNWAELWLNEAFATFFEAAVREKLYGREEYLRKVGTNADSFMTHDAAVPVSHGLYNRRAGDVSLLFKWPAVTYDKGGVFVHILREQVGEEAFWKALNLFLTRHRFSSVETADLRKVMEETSGQSLGWFFDQWVYGTSYPRLTVRQTFNASKKELRMDIRQTQSGDKLTPRAFRLPLEVELEYKDGTKELKEIEVDSRQQIVTLSAAADPAKVTFDPNKKVMLLSVKKR